jgi:hypothetical protein
MNCVDLGMNLLNDCIKNNIYLGNFAKSKKLKFIRHIRI